MLGRSLCEEAMERLLLPRDRTVCGFPGFLVGPCSGRHNGIPGSVPQALRSGHVGLGVMEAVVWKLRGKAAAGGREAQQCYLRY